MSQTLFTLLCPSLHGNHNAGYPPYLTSPDASQCILWLPHLSLPRMSGLLFLGVYVYRRLLSSGNHFCLTSKHEGQQAYNSAFPGASLQLGRCWEVSSTLEKHLPPSVTPSWKYPHGPAQRHVSYLSPDSVKLTVKTDHWVHLLCRCSNCSVYPSRVGTQEEEKRALVSGGGGLERWIHGWVITSLPEDPSYLPSINILGGSQPPVTPDARNLTPSSGLWGCLHICAYTYYIHIIKNKTIHF